MRIKNLFLLMMLGVLSAAAATPKYVFYFIGDGMGMGHVNATEYYNRFVLGNKQPILMYTFPVASQVMTYSADSPITDSAAAGTALSTGHKTRNGMLGMKPDTTNCYSAAKALKEQGWGIGILTSVAPDDATPAAFYAHQPYRGMYYEIGGDAIKSGYDFLGGASLRGAKGKDGNPTDLMDRINKAGIKVLTGLDGLKDASDSRVIVLAPEETRLNNNDISYTIDSVAGALTLQDLTAGAISHLQKRSPEKFFIMVEGGNIDHAAHSNDGGAVIKEVLNFQKAIKHAYDFYLRHPDETLIVITADHDTGGMAIGTHNNRYNPQLALIDCQRMSKDAFSDYCRDLIADGRTVTWNEMQAMLTDKFGFWKNFPVDGEQTARIRKSFDKTFVKKDGKETKGLYNTYYDFVSDVFKVMNDNTGIGFTTSHHTANPVPIFAIGAGSEKFTKVNNNVEIPRKILETVGIEALHCDRCSGAHKH